MSKALAVNTDTFSSEVINSPTPVIVDFWANWCGPCRMLGPVIDELSLDYAGKVKVVKVDVDQNQPLAAQYGVRSIPTLLFFNKGELKDRTVGVLPKADIAAKLDELLKS